MNLKREILLPYWIKRGLLRVGFLLLWFLQGSFFQASLVQASPAASVDELLEVVRSNVSTDFAKTEAAFEHLIPHQHDFNAAQNETFTLLRAAYLGLTGKNAERVALVRKAMNETSNANTRVKYLYQLSDSYVNLGEYEQALVVMNQGIRLLPKLTDLNAKVSIMQGAVTLLASLNAFEEASTYAVRLYQLGVSADNSNYICSGLANKVDIQFRLGSSQAAHSALKQTLAACDASEFQFLSVMLRATAAIDLIEHGQLEQGLKRALETLAEFEASNKDSDYISKLEEAIARAYHLLGQLDKAESYAQQAYQHARANQTKETILSASKTLAQINRANGKFEDALVLYDIYLREKALSEREVLAKNLAYQRVKYDNLDKTNQLALLKVKNASLSLTQKLQQRNNENLILVVSLGTVLLVFLSILLVLSLRRKQALVYDKPSESAQPGNGDINDCGQQAFELSRQKHSEFAVMLFELDFMAGYERVLDDNVSQVLVSQVSRICNDLIRQSDQFGRINEHQFVICLLDISEQGAVALAERAALAIEDIEVDNSDIPMPLTTTFGIAMLKECFVDYNEALGAADTALQRARGQDDRRVYVYHEEVH